jgi:hypothetical protein
MVFHGVFRPTWVFRPTYQGACHYATSAGEAHSEGSIPSIPPPPLPPSPTADKSVLELALYDFKITGTRVGDQCCPGSTVPVVQQVGGGFAQGVKGISVSPHIGKGVHEYVTSRHDLMVTDKQDDKQEMTRIKKA